MDAPISSVCVPSDEIKVWDTRVCYDCWHEGHDDLTVDQVIAVVKANVALAQKIVKKTIPKIVGHAGPSPHANALQNSFISDRSKITPEQRTALAPILSKYFPVD